MARGEPRIKASTDRLRERLAAHSDWDGVFAPRTVDPKRDRP